MVERKGVLLVMRRPDEKKTSDPKDFIPCIYCLGFVQKDASV